jgi:hypothetical protein
MLVSFKHDPLGSIFWVCLHVLHIVIGGFFDKANVMIMTLNTNMEI